jgi:heme/copper-type cytochrome/quinol oxidase subunit 2
MKVKLFLIIFLCVVFITPGVVSAASLSISPSTGTFSVGSTFDVSILLNTNGKSANALAVSLKFPPDMLQVVSPSTGQSVVGVWTAAPKFDNLTGRVDLQGGIPGGITASDGLITTLTFRVKSVGEAIVKFLDGSKVLLNDGLGTNAMSHTGNAVYEFKLPAPEGPQLVSETNPDQGRWYSNKTVTFRFASDTQGIKGYSYILSDDPGTIPDDINEGLKNQVSYTNLSDGIHYFHIKSLRDGVWGGTTHFGVKIDSTPPADFDVNISPSTRTSSRQPIIQFLTTDALSGIDHYELKIIPLSDINNKDATFFVETESPYTPTTLSLGTYDVIVRAYDKAQNYKEIVQRLVVTTPVFSFVSDQGIKLGNVNLSWMIVFIISIVLLAIALFIFFRVRIWHRKIRENHKEKKLPENIAKQLDELKKYRAKYGAKVVVAILIFISSILFSGKVFAQVNTGDSLTTSPPVITTLSKNISNQEVFYVGGKTYLPNEEVIIYIQNLLSGELSSKTTNSDKNGEWFYKHDTFLSPGNYIVWVQGKIEGVLSLTSSQEQMIVAKTAVKLLGNKFSYEDIYLLLALFLFVCILGLVIFIIIFSHRGRKKQKEFKKYLVEAEESIKRGFAVLKRDIEAELALISRAKLSGVISEEEKVREIELLNDFELVQKQIKKEIWELEHVEQ